MNSWLEYDAPRFAEGVAAELGRRVPTCRLLVLNPHQGLRLDEADRRCLLAFSGADALVIARSEAVEAKDGDRVFEANFGGDENTFERLSPLLTACAEMRTPQAVSAEDVLALIRVGGGIEDGRNSVLRDDELFAGEPLARGQRYLDGLASSLYGETTITAADLYYLSARISQRQAAIFHRLKGSLGSRGLDLESVGRYVRTAQLVESISTVRDALHVRWGTPRLELGFTGPPVVVLIDDNIAGPLRDALRLAAKLLWYGARLLLWNPAGRDGFGLKEILHLGALGSLLPVHEAKVEIEDFTAPGQPELRAWALGDLLSSATHVVVDQFFDEDGMSEGVRGPEVIRFLKRSLVAVRREGTEYCPRVVAFSRNESPELIAKAIRAGADGYVLKSTPLRLTEYIISGSPEPPETAHLSRNFECLDRLPPSLRSLISVVDVPPLYPKNKEWYRSKRLVSNTQVRDVGKLLRAIPKAELHVHVGSCMSREFLILASLIGLASQEKSWDCLARLAALLDVVTDNRRGRKACIYCKLPGLSTPTEFCFSPGLRGSTGSSAESWLRSLAASFVDFIHEHLEHDREIDAVRISQLRSFLRSELRIPDYESPDEAKAQLRERSSLAIVLAVLRTATSWSAGGISGDLDLAVISARDFEATFVRMYLLVLAAKGRVTLEVDGQDVSIDSSSFLSTLRRLSAVFFEHDGPLSVDRYRNAGWRTPQVSGSLEALSLVKVEWTVEDCDLCDATADPIGYTLASGLRSSSLADYLEGCEFSGSLHLQHPYLIHLYAEHVLFDMVREGIVYRELRGSPDGYANLDIGFSFGDACGCLVTAFSEGQSKCVSFLERSRSGLGEVGKEPWLPELAFGKSWKGEALERAFTSAVALERRLPPKVGLLLVGKRHKSSREMMLEAAAGTVLYQESGKGQGRRRGEVLDLLAQSGIVGFDLAGQESEYPPALFATEFERLGKLHIPLTVHAGENASSQFVEDAVLILGARRIGHALSLADDRHLMNRLREDRICVELCPLSNHQTCHFADPREPFGRKYPLEAYLDAGIPVCLNTDNPIISRTDIINEFFVAAATFKNRKLTLWLALLLVKTAFRSAFLPLPQRRILMRTVDHYIENLLLDRDVSELLERLADQKSTPRNMGSVREE